MDSKQTLEYKELIEHRDMVLNLRAVMNTEAGRGVLKYLFKSLDVAQVPEIGTEGPLLHDYLGFLRAGNSIFKIAAQADPRIAADILAQIEKERYAEAHDENETTSRG